MPFTFVNTVEQLLEVVKAIRNFRGKIWADIESTGLDWFVDEILLLQLKIKETIYVIDIRGLGYDSLRVIIEALADTGNMTGWHNGKFDLKFILHRTGILLENIYDSMIVETLLYVGRDGKQKFPKLSELCEKYTDVFMEKETRKDFINFPKDQPFTEKMLTYSALDVFPLDQIYEAQMKIVKETRQESVIELEMDLLPIVAKMEYDGISLNTKVWLEIEKEAIKRRDELYINFRKDIIDFLVSYKKAENALVLVEKSHLISKSKRTKKLQKYLVEITDFGLIREWIDENFNVKSTQAMTAIFNMMGIKTPNTNEKTLEKFREFAIVGKLVEIREVNKQIDQYGSNFLKSIHPLTGRIHTEYNQNGTRTGRFSSENPNLQNVPVKGGYRECFIPEPDYLFAALDYSQQEYRLTGAVSRDNMIINAYKIGSDMHTATARIMSGKVNGEEITKDERSLGKTLNFAILYGSSEYGLKRNLKISIDRAKELIETFFGGYERLSKFRDAIHKKIIELGYSCTPLGRRRYSEPEPLYSNSHELMMWKERVQREGFNHIIQGGGADIIKLAMVRIFRENPFGNYLRLCLQIHDEIVTQVHKDIAVDAVQFIKRIMEEEEQKFLGDVPAKVDGWDTLLTEWTK